MALEYGGVMSGRVEAPIAAYRHRTRLADNQYVFIQHGSYQCVPVEEQLDLEAGYVLLHRGIGEEKAFRFPAPLQLTTDQQVRITSEKSFKLQLEILSSSDLSFNSIHHRTKRAKTSHIHDGTWLTDELAAQRGMDIEHDPQTRALWRATHQGFALCGWKHSVRNPGDDAVGFGAACCCYDQCKHPERGCMRPRG